MDSWTCTLIAFLSDNGGKISRGAWKVFDVQTDLDESDNIDSSNKTVLGGLVVEGRKWSKTHEAPRWHDTENSLQSWIENKMPRYEETFRIK